MAGKRERVTLGRRDLRRISKVVRDAERGDRDLSATSLRTSDDGTDLVRGTFDGSWAKGAMQTVTHSQLPGVQYEAKNYFATLTNNGLKKCLIAYVAGEWILIAAEC